MVPERVMLHFQSIPQVPDTVVWSEENVTAGGGWLTNAVDSADYRIRHSVDIRRKTYGRRDSIGHIADGTRRPSNAVQRLWFGDRGS